MLVDLGTGLRIVLREPRPPPNVSNERRTELRIIWETSVVS
jgi:hypothetical protein